MNFVRLIPSGVRTGGRRNPASALSLSTRTGIAASAVTGSSCSILPSALSYSSAIPPVPPPCPPHCLQRRSFATIPKYGWGEATRLSVGDSCSLTKSFNAEDVLAYGKSCGDFNAVHYPDSYAKARKDAEDRWRSDPSTNALPLPNTGIFRFPRPIVHGMLTSSLIGALFASHFPGAIYLSQSLRFRAPVYYEEEVEAHIEVIDIEWKRKRIKCKTTIVKKQKKQKQDADAKTEGEEEIVVVDGEATVLLDSLQAKE